MNKYFIHYKFIRFFICGLCVPVLVLMLVPCLPSYALPSSQSVSIPMSVNGLLNGDGTLNVNAVRSYCTDFFSTSEFAGSVITLKPFVFSGSTTRNSLNDCYRLYVYFYDADKKMISNTNILGSPVFSGSNPYNFECSISGSFNVPSSSAYARFSMRNWTGTSSQPNYDVIYNTLPSVDFTYVYDDGSFNLSATFQPGNIYYPLNDMPVLHSDAKYSPSIDGSYLAGYDYFEGSVMVDSYLPVTLSGFGNSAYYDLDIVLTVGLSPIERSLSNGTENYSPESRWFRRLSLSFPTAYLSLPDGLNYSLSSSNLTNATALTYSANMLSPDDDRGVYKFTSNGDSTINVHIYGTVYVNDSFTFDLHLPAFVSAQAFDVNAYNPMSRLLAFKGSCSVSGIVQRSSYQSVSEIEALEKIDGSINDQTDEIKRQDAEEKSEASSTGDELGSTLNSVTDTLTAVEILKLPWTMLTDVYNAVTASGVQSLVFPSFELMGYTIWEEYEFNLSELDSNFEVLFKSVRLLSGFLICFAFGHYIRGYFVRLFGGDTEVD